MYSFDTWSGVLTSSFQNLWWGIISFVPNLLIALIIFVIGWLIGTVLGRWISQLFKSIKMDDALRGLGVGELMNKAGFELNAGGFIGGLVKWFVIVVFLVASLDVLHLEQVNLFLRQVVLGYLPNVIIAALILVISAVIAQALQRLVTGAARAAGLESAKLFGGLVRWAVWVFALLVALQTLGIAGAFAQTLFTGIVGMLALAGGLAFGLGGRDAAARYLDKLHSDISNRHH